MITDLEFVSQIFSSKDQFGCKCKKLTGAFTVELLRKVLIEESFNPSPRDVFIKGLPIELDLLLLKKPSSSLIYDKDEVISAIEIKFSGCYGENSLKKVQNDFLKTRSFGVKCIYISIADRNSYKYRATQDKLKAPTFQIFNHTNDNYKE